VVVQVLVTQRQGVDALGDEVFYGVLCPVGIAVVGKAGGQALEQPQAPIDLAQQNPAGVGSQVSAVEIRRDPAASKA
jgi:hypothetical protein